MVMDQESMKLITRCIHCGEECGRGTKYCANCGTADKRREMCRINKEIFEKAGKVFNSPSCRKYLEE